ncbi:MAG TPA: 2-oxoacid:acceptor oxidoreductase family protein, partial [Dehalococcoidia bacterium]|nr:2-oxoacid:acceptor oxidoreductase family protein [Dehalococcoidia bacterium]
MESKPRLEVTITGLGGQGALLFGQLLSEAGVSKYKNVAYFPQYATIMRGGESECTVTLSDEEIDSLLVYEPQAAVVMGAPKLKVYEKRVKSGGLMMVDSSVISEKVERKDIKVFYVPATKISAALGDRPVANLVFLGAYIEATKAVPPEIIEKVLEKKLKGGKEAMLLLNKKALQEGAR